MADKPRITQNEVYPAYDSRFIKIYGLEYVKGRQYMNASRRDIDELVATKSDEEIKEMLPDAVSCVVIVNGDNPKLLMNYEFRYPTGQFLLSVPAGLIDKEDKEFDDAVVRTAIREMKEETNIDISENDRVEIINPLLFSSPGMTDESNAVVLVVINDSAGLDINQSGALGGEKFEGFELLDKSDAMRILKQGRDDNGIFYSVYTWMALMYFVSDFWK